MVLHAANKPTSAAPLQTVHLVDATTTTERNTGTTAALYIDYVGPPYPVLSRAADSSVCPASIKRGLNLVFRDSVIRRNPRTADYMSQRVAERYGADAAARIQPIAKGTDLDLEAVRRASHIVLLWRDGNGTGCHGIERILLAQRGPKTPVTVLNGRRRQFELTPRTRRAYLLRRGLAKSFLLEAIAFVIFWLITPALAGWDLIRKQR